MIGVQEVKSKNIFRVEGPQGAKVFNINKLGKKMAKFKANEYAQELNQAIEFKQTGHFYAKYNLMEAVEKFAEDFARLNRAKSSLPRYMNELRRIVGTKENPSKFADMPIKAFKLADVDKIEDYLQETGHSRKSAHRSLKSLKYVFKICVKHSWLKLNPMTEWRWDSGTDNADTAIAAEGEVVIPERWELDMLLNVKEERWRLFFLLAATTGMRSSELCGLAWSNIDFGNNKIYVLQQRDQDNILTTRLKTKNSNRWIPLLAQTKAALLDYAKKHDINLGNNEDPTENVTVRHDLVFKTEQQCKKDGSVWNEGGKSISKQKVNQVFNNYKARLVSGGGKYLKKAKGMHSLRHYYASKLIEANKKKEISLLELSKFMGHHSYNFTLSVYGHLIKDQEAEQRVVKDLSATFDLS